MATPEDIKFKDEDGEEESEHRRSRLWLGYSEDNLRGIQYSQSRQENIQAPGNESATASKDQRNGLGRDYITPDHYKSDESVAASPAESPQNVRRKSRPEGRNIQATVTDDSDVPDDFDNLDELTAPSPVEGSQGERKQGFLEDRNTQAASPEGSNVPADFENLDEIAAPSPVEESQSDRKEGYLEDRFGGTSAKRPNGKSGDRRNSRDIVTRYGVEEFWTGRQSGQLHGPVGESPSSSQDGMQKKAPVSHEKGNKLATEIYTMSYLIFFSILGTLARLGLQALTFYPGAPVQTGLLWANVGGSLILGLLSEDRKLFRDHEVSSAPVKSKDEEKGRPLQRSRSAGERHAAVKKTIPLYIGLAIGFCGSFTSFSSFMRDAYYALANALPVPIQHPSSAPISQNIDVHRNPGYSFLAVLAVLIITVGLSLMALNFGAHLALFLEPYSPSISSLFIRRLIDRVVVFLAIGCWLAAIFMAIWPPDRLGGPTANASAKQETWRSQALFALVFAPLGCLLRFYASIHLNGRIKSFPLGTFAVNIFGTAMEAMFIDLQRVPVGNMVGCQVLQGMSDGFCGCLTTVSTWVVELTALRRRHAYFYGMMSVGIGLSLFIIISGSLQWTRGFAHPLCMS